jgi:hypothetical protein
VAQYTSYDVVGKKEDVSDIISNISPTKTPFQSLIGNTTVDNTVFQWQEDAIRDVKVNKKKEGFTAASSERAPTVMRENVTQIMEETISVSGTNDRVKKYGRAKESAYQSSLAAAALKRDLEHAFVGTGQAAVKPVNNSTERQMAGAQELIHEDMYFYTGTTGGGSDPAPFNEAKYLAALEGVYEEGADPEVTFVTPANSLVVADFAKSSGRYRDIPNGGKDRAIVNAVNLYVSPFGESRIVLNRFQKAGDTLIIDPAMWEKATLRPWTREKLAKTGDSDEWMIVGEFSLKHKNFKAGALVREGADPAA